MNLNLALIEQALKDEMADQIKNKVWPWVREIKTYGGEFDDDTLSFIKTFPAIWVSFVSSGTPTKISYNKTEYPITFVVLVGAQSVRNEEARRHGAGSDIGTFSMLDLVQRLLIGNDLSSQGIEGLASLEEEYEISYNMLGHSSRSNLDYLTSLKEKLEAKEKAES